MRVLITGASGFIASYLPVLRDDVEDVMGIDLETGDDIRLQGTMDKIREFAPEIVFHLAAHHFVPWTEANPIETERTNVMGTANVLEACKHSVKTFVLASSAAVYGYWPSPIPESAPLLGRSVYANTKYQAEVMLRRYATDDAAFVAARMFNVVGPGDRWEHILPMIIKNRHDTLYVGNTWPKRDYIHATDAGNALWFLSQNAPYGFSAYNIGTGIGTSVTGLCDLVSDIANIKIRRETLAGKVRADDGHLVADPSRLAHLGWSATRTLEDAIIDILSDEIDQQIPPSL